MDKQTFINTLNNLEGISDFSRKMPIKERLAKEDQNRAIKETYLTSIFSGRTTFCFISSDFWVFCDTLEDTLVVKQQAYDLGFLNVHTFVPKAEGENGKTIVDPKGNFAVAVNGTEEMVIGDLARSFYRILNPILEVANAHICMRHGHMGRLQLKINNEDAANILVERLTKLVALTKERFPYKFSFGLEQDNLDTWNLRIEASLN